jgi:dsDNA-specific endonuclease/ATPase MutS2
MFTCRCSATLHCAWRLAADEPRSSRCFRSHLPSPDVFWTLQEEETERAEAEAAAAKALADAARKEARAAHRAQLKKEGKLLTGKAKKEAERLAAMREQLLANTDIQLGDINHAMWTRLGCCTATCDCQAITYRVT